jgi:hypothetical protein
MNVFLMLKLEEEQKKICSGKNSKKNEPLKSREPPNKIHHTIINK